MKDIPSYAKVAHIGSAGTQDLFMGEDIIIQEKVDGSQFGFGWNEDGVLICRSKGKIQDIDHPDHMFRTAVDYIKTVPVIGPNYFMYCEYLEKPKHNVLCYDHTPTHNLVLFDALSPNGTFLGKDLASLQELANRLGIDCIPILHRGPATTETLIELLTTPSYLGREIIEGVVVKNYDQCINLYGHIFPLICKYVREAFKERHGIEWADQKPAKQSIDLFVQSFKSEARWRKAIIHAREADELTQSPKDIGLLIRYIQNDITEEESEFIKNRLYSMIEKDLMRFATSGFPEWYKQSLMENVN